MISGLQGRSSVMLYIKVKAEASSAAMCWESMYSVPCKLAWSKPVPLPRTPIHMCRSSLDAIMTLQCYLAEAGGVLGRSPAHQL